MRPARSRYSVSSRKNRIEFLFLFVLVCSLLGILSIQNIEQRRQIAATKGFFAGTQKLKQAKGIFLLKIYQVEESIWNLHYFDFDYPGYFDDRGVFLQRPYWLRFDNLESVQYSNGYRDAVFSGISNRINPKLPENYFFTAIYLNNSFFDTWISRLPEPGEKIRPDALPSDHAPGLEALIMEAPGPQIIDLHPLPVELNTKPYNIMIVPIKVVTKETLGGDWNFFQTLKYSGLSGSPIRSNTGSA